MMNAPTHPHWLLHDALVYGAAGADAQRQRMWVDGTWHSIAQLHDAAAGLAGALRHRGVEAGDRVAIYMDNSWPCIVSVYAASMAGAAFVLVNPQTRADKLRHVLDDSGARALLAGGNLAQQFEPAVQGNRHLQVLVVAGDYTGSTQAIRFADAVGSAPLDEQERVIATDLAALIYTSGSSGEPKGVMHSHQTMMFAAASVAAYLRITACDRLHCALPLAFSYGLYHLLMAINQGAQLVLEHSFAYPAAVFANMREQAVTLFPAVPTMYSTLLASHRREPLQFPSVTRITSAGAALPDSHAAQLLEVFPNAGLYRMYGQTECKRISYLAPGLGDSRPGSVGKAIPGTQALVLDAFGQPAAPGEIGLLHVRGPHIMLGYWNRPQETAHALRPGPAPGERMLCTHDLFRSDAEGFLYFVARSDDIINSGGEKVSPAEVENVLYRLAGVREAAVLGIADERLGEMVCAFIAIDPDAGLDERRIRAHCIAHLEPFRVPRRIILVNNLPRSANGKLDRTRIRAQLTQGGTAAPA